MLFFPIPDCGRQYMAVRLGSERSIQASYIRSLIYGERFAFELFRGIPWEVFNRIDHLTFYIGIPVFSAYLTIIFEREVARIPMYVYQALGLVFSLFLFFPPSVFNVTVTWYEIITACYVLYFLFISIRALIRRTEGALTTMIGLAIFLCFGINEILFNMGIINTYNSLSIGLVLFLFTQSVLIAMRFSKAFNQSETLGTSLFNMNASLRRFIPQEFFMLLQRTEFDDIRLGDQVEKKCPSCLQIFAVLPHLLNNLVQLRPSLS